MCELIKSMGKLKKELWDIKGRIVISRLDKIEGKIVGY